MFQRYLIWVLQQCQILDWDYRFLLFHLGDWAIKPKGEQRWRELPQKRDHLVSHFLLIVFIAFKSFLQYGFFTGDALGDEWNISQHNQKRDGRTQYQWYGQKHHCCGHIHGMADNAVQPRVDDLLTVLDLYGAGKSRMQRTIIQSKNLVSAFISKSLSIFLYL